MVGKMTGKELVTSDDYNEALFSAYNLFSIGLGVGLSNLVCGYILYYLEYVLVLLDQVVL
jgi:hypothetical protein